MCDKNAAVAHTSMRLGIVLGLLALGVSAPARAELVHFANGRAMSVKAHRIEEGRLVLELRSGGQIVCDPGIVAQILPDEVPYPTPEPDVPVEPRADLSIAESEPAATPYDSIITRASATHGVDARLVRAMIQVESGYQERARSPKGAMGLMQLMPATARRYALSDPYDPVANIETGVKYLRSLLDRFPLRLALAAYNAGEGAVERSRGVPPYPETRTYVRRILEQLAR